MIYWLGYLQIYHYIVGFGCFIVIKIVCSYVSSISSHFRILHPNNALGLLTALSNNCTPSAAAYPEC